METVLFVDDDPLIREVAKEIFIHNGFNCILCETYECAILTIENAKIDIIVLDIVLKGIKSGIDILNYLQSKKNKIPVLVTTGYGDVYREKLSFYPVKKLEKPYSPEELILTIKEIK